MKRNKAGRFGQALVALFALLSPILTLAADAQDSRQAVCQASWERCLGNVEGKNWKPVYDRCLKARTVCLGGQAYTPAVAPITSSASTAWTGLQENGSGSDPANADPATRAVLCQKGQARGNSSSCTLAAAGEGYGQNFSLIGPGVPMSRIQRASSVVKCAGGSVAMFYPNGRIESCTLDDYGAQGTALTDAGGKTVTCASRAFTRFDPEGRVLSCNSF